MQLPKHFLSNDYYFAILSGAQRFRVFVVLFVLSTIFTILPTYYIYKDGLPMVQNLQDKILALVDEAYPEELEIDIKDGKASTNVTEPFYINIRKSALESIFALKNSSPNSVSKIRLLVIDTKARVEDIESYQSLALLTERSVVYYDNNDLKITPLSNIPNTRITKDEIRGKILELNKDNIIGSIIFYSVLFSPLFIISVTFMGNLVYLFLVSLLILIIVKVYQLPYGCRNTFRFTAAIGVVVLVIWEVLELVPVIGVYVAQLKVFQIVVILSLAFLIIQKILKKVPDEQQLSLDYSTGVKAPEDRSPVDASSIG